MKFRVVALRLARCRSLAREALRVLAWPAILCAGLAGTSAALATASPMFWFNLVYLGVVLLILACERILPYERAWQANDGDARRSGSYLVHQGRGAAGAYLATLAGAASAIALQPAASQAGPWPAQWPMALQVVLGLVVAELGLYVAHRAAHEWRPLWRFHALHHSVRRLWVINTGRFHIVDTLMKIACSQTPLLLLGAPCACSCGSARPPPSSACSLIATSTCARASWIGSSARRRCIAGITPSACPGQSQLR